MMDNVIVIEDRDNNGDETNEKKVEEKDKKDSGNEENEKDKKDSGNEEDEKEMHEFCEGGF